MPSDPKRPPASDRLIWEKPDPEAPAAAPRPAKARRRAGSRKVLIWISVGVVVVAGGGVAVYEVGHSKSSGHDTAAVSGQSTQTAAGTAVQAPFRTFSSATDGTTSFQQSGTKFKIAGAGADLWTDADAYTTIYRSGAAKPGMAIETKIIGQSNMTKDAKAGIIVRNSMTGSGTSPEGVVLFESPSGGIRLDWNGNGGNSIDEVSPAADESVPVFLKLVVVSRGSYIGYYSTDGKKWIKVGSAKVPGQDTTQDAGMFVTSHVKGQDGTVAFSGFTATTVSPAGTATSTSTSSSKG